MGQGQFTGPLTRRHFVGAAAATAVTATVTNGLVGKALAAAPGAAGPVGLPSPAQMRADVQAMVDFGPRLVGTDAHNAFADWAESEMEAAGLQVLPCDNYTYKRWDHSSSSLDVLDGGSAGAVPIASTYVRSGSTPAGGLTAPLFYGGDYPVASGLAALTGAPEQDPAAAEAWKASVGEQARGKIVVVDVDSPGKLTLAVFLAISAYNQTSGESDAELATHDYTRVWLGPWPPLQALKDVGAVGAVFILNAPQAAIDGTYSNHTAPYQDTPTLFVGNDEVGSRLRETAKQGPTANLKVIAPTVDTVVRSVTAILPGESDEVSIIASHSDGQNAFEENGTVAVVQLARHFASLPAGQRLKRTLVFMTYPGHTGGRSLPDGEGRTRSYLPETSGWIERHADLADRAASAVFIEHLGAREWTFADGQGYRDSGEFEPYGIWATQGIVQAQAIDALKASGVLNASILKPPIEISPGEPFHEKGIPHVAGIAGPSYLLVVSDDGEMDKFDETHAAQQLAFYADVVKRLDGLDRDAMRQGDPTLGEGYELPDRSAEIGCVAPAPVPAGAPAPGPAQTLTVPVPATSTTPASALTVKFFGRRRKFSGVVVTIAASNGTTSGVTVELRRNGRTVARTKAVSVAQAAKRVVLKRSNDRKFATGEYKLVVRANGKVLQTRTVKLGK